jgi:hypothetical protein
MRATPLTPSPPPTVERDDGYFQIGIEDHAPGPFETRNFAEAIRLRMSSLDPRWGVA